MALTTQLYLSVEVLNDEHIGTGSLVTREEPSALERGRRRLYELVCPHGSGRRAGGERAALGSDALPEELDPGPLCRARAVVLAGRDARSASHRSHRALGRAPRGSAEGSARAGRNASLACAGVALDR